MDDSTDVNKDPVPSAAETETETETEADAGGVKGLPRLHGSQDSRRSKGRSPHRGSGDRSSRSHNTRNISSQRLVGSEKSNPRSLSARGRSNSSRNRSSAAKKDDNSDDPKAAIRRRRQKEDRDAKRQGHRQRSKTAVPGAQSVRSEEESQETRKMRREKSSRGSASGSGSRSKRSSSSDRLSASDRNLKYKSSSQSSKSRRAAPATVPGVQAVTACSESRGDRKLQAKSRGYSSSASRSASPLNHGREQKRAAKEKEASISVGLPMANESTNLTGGEAEIAVEAEAGDDALALAAELVEDEDEETKMRRKVDAETLALRRQIEQQQDQINQMELNNDSDNRGNRKFLNIKVIFVALVLIAGGATGAVLALGGSESSTKPLVPNVGESEAPTLNQTTVPPTESNETGTPTDSPTKELKYDPPSPEECVDIASNNFTEEEDPTLVARNFELPMEIMGASDDITAEEVSQVLESALQGEAMPELAGCSTETTRRRTLQSNLRTLQSQDYRYVVARGRFSSRVAGQCTSAGARPCIRILVEMILYLKGEESFFTLSTLISSVLDVSEESLVEKLGLGDVCEEIVLQSIESTDDLPPSAVPTPRSSGLPTELPTLSPSGNPSRAPAVGPTTDEPTRKPSLAPSTVPTQSVAKTPNRESFATELWSHSVRHSSTNESSNNEPHKVPNQNSVTSSI
ncbi:MAG: hypothetical protein SGBAC_010439, partial [Bacillariaceae sp.]